MTTAQAPHIQPPAWPGLSALCLICVSLAAIGGVFTDWRFLIWPEALGLLAFFALEFRGLSKMARFLVAVCIALVVFETATARLDADITAQAINRAAFMVVFLNSLSFLQHAAGRAPLLRTLGHILGHQPPGRRYLVLTFGAALFGMLLNLSAIGLLGTMIAKGVAPGTTAEDQRIAAIRRKRMTLAMIRGFCSIPMWSPITVTIALITAAIPGLKWAEIAIYSAPLGVCFLLLGWVFDRHAYPQRTPPAHSNPPSLRGLVPLLALAVAVPSLALGLSQILGTSMIVALLLALPVISAGWLWLQERTQPRAMARVGHEIGHKILPNLPTMRTEITLFACSAFLGVMVAHIIDTDAMGHAITTAGLSSGATLAISAWLIVGLALVGVNPIVSVTILAGTLPKLAALAISPVAVGVMLVSVWTISVNTTPYSTAVRLSARMLGTATPGQIGPAWNGSYAFAMLCLLSVLLLSFG